MSLAKRARKKRIREGHLDPTASRQTWSRKPMSQVVPNKKAEQRRTYCRKGDWDGVCHYVSNFMMSRQIYPKHLL